jgi:hypothetical protein
MVDRLQGYGGTAQRSLTIGKCLNGGLGWLEIEWPRYFWLALPTADSFAAAPTHHSITSSACNMYDAGTVSPNAGMSRSLLNYVGPTLPG